MPMHFDEDNNLYVTMDAGEGAGITDTELRATPVPVSVSGVATAAKQDTIITALTAVNASLDAIEAAEAVAPTVVDLSITNMTGSSQTVVSAAAGTKLVFLQAPTTNVGTIWFNLAGGTAVVGTGVPLIPGGYLTIQPGIANAITGIAATANDDLTVYGG